MKEHYQQNKSFYVNCDNIINYDDVSFLVKMAARKLKRESYFTIGSFLKELSFNELKDIDSLYQYSKDFVLLTTILLQAEGLEVNRESVTFAINKLREYNLLCLMDKDEVDYNSLSLEYSNN